MTDLAVEDQPSGDANNAGAATAGSLLKQARERQQVDMAVLASVLKVSEHKIRALENNQLDALPDLAFARSLAASLARMLELDPAPVLALLPKAAPASRVAHEPLNAPYHPQNEAGMIGRAFSALQSRYLWVVLALLLAAVVLALLPQVREEGVAEGAATPASGNGMVTREVSSPAQPAAVVPAAPVVPAVPVVPLEALAAPAASASAAVSALPVASAAAVTAVPSDELQFSATQDSWIQVHDGSGKQLLSRTVRAGERVGLSGTAPYRVVVGNVAGVSLQVRGQAFDLAGAAKGGTTARVNVP